MEHAKAACNLLNGAFFDDRPIRVDPDIGGDLGQRASACLEKLLRAQRNP